MPERRVVVTGVGAVSPLGLGYEAFTAGLFEGRSGIGPITLFDASTSAVRVAGEVREYSDDLLPSDPRHHVVLSRPMKLGLVAAAECVHMSGLDATPTAKLRTACLMALSRWEIELNDFGESFARSMEPCADEPSGYRFRRDYYASRGHRAVHPLWLLKFIPNIATAHVVRTFGLEGEANTYTGEAAASLQLLGHAAQSIREGLYDLALCGGSDSRISTAGLGRYFPLGILAPGDDGEAVSKPFDRTSNGYIVGEGAAFFCVEGLDHALARGAKPIAEIVGWGDGSDAYHVYHPHPEARGLQTSMESALGVANISANEVDAVVATAASLPDLDAAEASALRTVLGGHVPAVTAPAGSIGRTHVAVGAMGAAAALAAISSQSVPPTANTSQPATDAPPGLVLGTSPRAMPVRNVLVNAWSIGGQCASAIFREVIP